MSEVKRPRWPDCLGDTEEAIAATLTSAGVKGRKGCPYNCVIARSYKHFYPDGWCGIKASYVINYVKDVKRVVLTFNDSQIMDPIATHSEALAIFMANFDRGLYPQLELPPVADKVKSL